MNIVTPVWFSAKVFPKRTGETRRFHSQFESSVWVNNMHLGAEKAWNMSSIISLHRLRCSRMDFSCLKEDTELFRCPLIPSSVLRAAESQNRGEMVYFENVLDVQVQREGWQKPKNLLSHFKVLQTEEKIDRKDLFYSFFKNDFWFPHYGAKHWWPVFVCFGRWLTTLSRFLVN